MEYAQLVQAAKAIAQTHVLDPALICAIVEQESDWDPWAIRHEPGFEEKYVKPLHLCDTEEVARSISWGLMQVMGESARELGFRDKMASLCDPFTGLDWGCRVFGKKFDAEGSDVKKALLAYNGGGNPNYADQVLARVEHYYTV